MSVNGVLFVTDDVWINKLALCLTFNLSHEIFPNLIVELELDYWNLENKYLPITQDRRKNIYFESSCTPATVSPDRAWE